MARKFDPKGTAARFLAAVLALIVWQAAAWAISNRLLLVGPVQVVLRLATLVVQATFWQAVGFTFTRIVSGFLLAFLLALLLAAFAARFPVVQTLLRPYMAAVQAVPVASFIVIALLWLSSRKLSVFIAFLMVLPLLYAAFLAGIQAADTKLLEMARVFSMPYGNRIRCIYAPAVRPYLLSACHVALGLCWKAGVAAEVIGLTGGSIGGMLYDAKIYLEIPDLFAWTLVVVLISVCFEKAFTLLLGKLFCRMEGRKWN